MIFLFYEKKIIFNQCSTFIHPEKFKKYPVFWCFRVYISGKLIENELKIFRKSIFLTIPRVKFKTWEFPYFIVIVFVTRTKCQEFLMSWTLFQLAKYCLLYVEVNRQEMYRFPLQTIRRFLKYSFPNDSVQVFLQWLHKISHYISVDISTSAVA